MNIETQAGMREWRVLLIMSNDSWKVLSLTKSLTMPCNEISRQTPS
jgi:hypothetical protein